MIDCFGDRVKYWLTFNEQNIFHMPEAFRISGYMKAIKPCASCTSCSTIPWWRTWR